MKVSPTSYDRKRAVRDIARHIYIRLVAEANVYGRTSRKEDERAQLTGLARHAVLAAEIIEEELGEDEHG